jgi:hypothetical protein
LLENGGGEYYNGVSNMSNQEVIARELSISLTKLLENYYTLTLNIGVIIEKDKVEGGEGESILEIEEIFNQREIIQNQFDEAKKSLWQLSEIINPAIQSELQQEEAKRNQLIERISIVDSENMQKLTRLFNEHQGKIDQIQQGKKLHNAYDAHHPSAWGVFVDKKK